MSAGRSSANIPVVMTDDGADEGDETVVLTLTDGSGYTVGKQSVHTLTIEDNDNPPPATPVVSISGGGAVTEGAAATFRLSATPASAADITVKVTLTERGAFAGSGQKGARNVVIGASGAATLTVKTLDDANDEADGVITASVATGSG